VHTGQTIGLVIRTRLGIWWGIRPRDWLPRSMSGDEAVEFATARCRAVGAARQQLRERVTMTRFEYTIRSFCSPRILAARLANPRQPAAAAIRPQIRKGRCKRAGTRAISPRRSARVVISADSSALNPRAPDTYNLQGRFSDQFSTAGGGGVAGGRDPRRETQNPLTLVISSGTDRREVKLGRSQAAAAGCAFVGPRVAGAKHTTMENGKWPEVKQNSPERRATATSNGATKRRTRCR